MTPRLKKAALLLTVAPFLVLGACASSDDVQSLRDEVRQAREAADLATKEAREAKAAAATAQEKADVAARAAGGASKKADRMYRESLRK
jgi:hypothetical protein